MYTQDEQYRDLVRMIRRAINDYRQRHDYRIGVTVILRALTHVGAKVAKGDW